MSWKHFICFAVLLFVCPMGATSADDALPGEGKHVVLISGDEEYRSEEAVALLADLLSERHGFACTTLYAIDPATGEIQPNIPDNIPGLKALEDADLMVIFTRFRNLPDDQMKKIDAYLKSGRPVIGIRTATHAFKIPGSSPWAHYSNGYAGEKKEWADGFGRLVLGEKWIAHHGHHRHESTRGVVAPNAKEHPIARGLGDENIWGPSDVYRVRLPLPDDSEPIVLGKVMARPRDYDEADRWYGMRPDDGPAVDEKNDPMMPIAWTKSYQLPGGEKGVAFASTIGAATDLESEGVRRLLVNAAYWCVGLGDNIPAEGTNVDLLKDFTPEPFGFREDAYWEGRDLTPEDLE